MQASGRWPRQVLTYHLRVVNILPGEAVGRASLRLGRRVRLVRGYGAGTWLWSWAGLFCIGLCRLAGGRPGASAPSPSCVQCETSSCPEVLTVSGCECVVIEALVTGRFLRASHCSGAQEAPLRPPQPQGRDSVCCH